MTKLTQTLTALALGLATTVTMASPKQLVTHNYSNAESNAFVAGTIPSQHPTKAHSEGRVAWAAVRMACFGHMSNGRCWAVIKMGTNTPNPIELGTVSIDLDSGEIFPNQVSANGYTFTVNGPGEATITNS